MCSRALLLLSIIFLHRQRIDCIRDFESKRILKGKETHLKTAEELAEAKRFLNEKQLEWLNNSIIYHDGLRDLHISSLLHQISGIYKNKDKVKNTKLEKTVLINVVETTDADVQTDKYNNYLRNLLCFTKHYDFESVVYLIDGNQTRFNIAAKELMHFDKSIKVAQYPYERFWKLIASKTTVINEGFGKGDYMGSIPSFKHFGSLVMLVPILEALELGFNVIFFDVDIALVKDPLPHLLHGDADVIVSPELRVCTFPSFSADSYDWKSLEPNTGTMHVRASPRGVQFFQRWLQRIVQGNVMNDQRDVNFQQEEHAEQVANCVQHNNLVPQSLIADSHPHNFNSSPQSNSSRVFKYCYLNEFMFQNGLMEFYCSKGKRGSSVSAYMLGMERFGVVSHLHHTTNDSNHHNNSKTIMSSVSRSRGYNKVYSPITMHVNFCVTKRKGLDERGLWLYKSDTCEHYDVRRSYFAKVNWTEKITHAHLEFAEKMAAANLTEGALVKYSHSGSVYLFRNRSVRAFPNRETFLKMGYDFDNVKVLRHQLFLLIPVGPELPDLTLSSSSKPASIASPAKHQTNMLPTQTTSTTNTNTNRDLIKGSEYLEPSIRIMNRLYAAFHNTTLGLSHASYAANTVDSIRARAALLMQVAHDPGRTKRVLSVLNDVAGIYVDSSRLQQHPKQSRMRKTVLLTVLEAQIEGSDKAKDPNSQYRYKRLIKNHLCYNQQHGFISLVYIIDSNATRFTMESNVLKALDPNIRVIEYPYELFWRTVAQKQQSRFNVDYAGMQPTFKHFGFLVMLVPILEALQLGFDVAYFDVDTAILRDPFPYLLQGDADINVSPEMRTCIYPSIPDNQPKIKWFDMEPNTGAMLVRSSPHMLAFYNKWLFDMVQNSDSTDQKLLMKLFSELAEQTFSCNPLANDIFNSSHSNPAGSSRNISYCFLNELLFQNGKLALSCAFDRQGSRSEYLTSLATTLQHYDNTTRQPGSYRAVLAASELYRTLHSLKLQGSSYLGFTPLTIHANYVDEKIDGMYDLGLWLADNSEDSESVPKKVGSQSESSLLQCKSFVLKDTYFGKLNWLNELTVARTQMEAVRGMPNNTIFKQEHKPLLYLVINDTIRPFNSGETFLAMGYQWNQVKSIKQQFSFFMNFTLGLPL